MQITLTTDGGFAFVPGLARPRTLDVDALPPAARDELCRLVDAVRGQTCAAPAPAGADRRTLIVEVRDGGRGDATWRIAEPISDARFRALVEAIRAHLRPVGHDAQR